MAGHSGIYRTLKKGVRKPRSIPRYVGERLGNAAPLIRYDPAFKLSLALRGAALSPDRPETGVVDTNEALPSEAPVHDAVSALQTAGLHTHPLEAKNWDALGALASVLANTTTDATVLDAGGETYSPLVEWLYLYGYRGLHVHNIDFDRDFRRGSIRYVESDFTDTDFDRESVDVVTSLSVVEHGVPLEPMLAEFHRILKPGGRLVVSTDFWPDGRDTADLTTSYGDSTQEWTIYDVDGIEELVAAADDAGFELTGEVDYAVEDPPVEYWGVEYTFILLEFVRE